MMTEEEKKAQMDLRNEKICAYYSEGKTLSETASKFALGRQRVAQVLKKGGVWRSYEKGNRTKFLGVTVSEETKDGLSKLAEHRGISVSRLTSGLLDEAVK